MEGRLGSMDASSQALAIGAHGQKNYPVRLVPSSQLPVSAWVRLDSSKPIPASISHKGSCFMTAKHHDPSQRMSIMKLELF